MIRVSEWLWLGSFTQNRRKYDIFSSFSFILVVYLGHGIFHPVVVVAVLFFSKSVFGIDMPSSSQVEESQKKKRRISIVARVSQGEK